MFLNECGELTSQRRSDQTAHVGGRGGERRRWDQTCAREGRKEEISCWGALGIFDGKIQEVMRIFLFVFSEEGRKEGDMERQRRRGEERRAVREKEARCSSSSPPFVLSPQMTRQSGRSEIAQTAVCVCVCVGKRERV